MIELKDNSTAERKKPTGYVVAAKTEGLKDTTPGIGFIKRSDLQAFMGAEYNNTWHKPAKAIPDVSRRAALLDHDGEAERVQPHVHEYASAEAVGCD